MLNFVKIIIKKILYYSALPGTVQFRKAINVIKTPGLPYCPPAEGDIIFLLIQKNIAKIILRLAFIQEAPLST
jgi:hypothetical protein